MKKTLALVLAFALVFSTVTFAFADDAAISADAKVCADLGMLVGDGNGVTAAYTATAPTRIQSAVMFLRLKGLYDEAIKFAGTDNFADGNIAWAEGKNLLAYLKANPQLGWQGDGKNFNPNNPITAKEYYKVMLQALGYVQSSATVAGGDFSWDNVIEFAATKGLTKAAAVANFTINDVAVATVEALKGNMKEGGKTLAAGLVEAGKVDKAKAVAAGLYTDAAATTTVALKAAKAVGNNKIEVEYAADVDKAYAENLANYAIVEKGTTTAVEVKSAMIDGTTKVVLETAALTAGKAYTITVNAVAKNFGGIAKDTAAPEIDTVTGTDTERVEIAFTKLMDLATALDVNTYKIDGITVEAAAWADSTRKIVELTTKGLVANKSYKVTVANIKSVDGVVLKSASKNFMAKSDKTAPKVTELVTTGNGQSTNTRIIVVFDQEVTAESAQNLANYKLTVGSSDTNTLEITAAKLVADINDWNGDGADDDMSVVELTTVSQKAGQKYVLHVDNIVDTAVLANEMKKEQEINYYGKKVDDSKPTATAADYVTNAIIDIDFNDDSRLDPASALDIANYTVNNDIAVQKAEWSDADDPDCKTVRLTVDTLGDKGSYTITINNVADEYGNVIKEKKFTKTFNEDTVNVPATVDYVKATGENTIKVKFTKEVDSTTAKDPANYTIDKEIGTPVKASYDAPSLTTTLTVNDLADNTEYKVTVDGVKDLAGNIITGVSAKAVRATGANDTTAPEIESIEAVNNKVVRITFDEPIAVDQDANTPTIGISTDSDAAVEINGQYAVSADDDDMVLEFTLDDTFSSDADVKLVASTVRDLAGNKLVVDAGDNAEEFSAVADDPEEVELASWEQVSVKKFKLQFAEKIDDSIDGDVIPSGANVPYGLTVDVDADDNTIVYLKSNVVMDVDKTFNLDLSALGFANYHGVAVAEDEDTGKTEMVTSLEDEDDPYIESVEADSKTTIAVDFNEDLATPGDYEIKYEDEDGKTQTITSANVDAAVDADDNSIVNLTLTGGKRLYSKYSYTLYVKTAAKDVAYNALDTDATFDFAGSDVTAVGQYVTGVKIVNGTEFKLVTFSSVDPDGKTMTLAYDDSDVALTSGGKPDEDTGADDAACKTFTVHINTTTGIDLDGDGAVTAEVINGVDESTFVLPVAALADGVTYTATFDGKSYDFEGTVTDDITYQVDGANYVFSYEDMADGDVVAIIDHGVAEVGTVVNSDLEAEIATADVADNVVDILVIRDGVVLFYAHGADLTE